MAVNDTLRLSVIGTVATQQHVHTLHFRNSTIGDQEQAIIDAWQANCRNAYRDMFTTSDSPVQRFSVQQVCGSVPLRSALEEVEVSPNIAGSWLTSGGAVHAISPSFVAAVVSVKTALAGRSRRGRFYIGGVPEAELNINSLSPAYTAKIQAYINVLLTRFGALSVLHEFNLVVHSPTLAKVPGSQCQNTSTLVNGMTINPLIGTMRSRKAGSGL